MDQRELSGRLARWSLKLQGFNFNIEHRKGKLNVVPDTLSRVLVEEIIPVEETGVDLNSNAFLSEDYSHMRTAISENPDRFPDLKVDGTLVFRRIAFRDTEVVSESGLWRLWIPSDLTKKLIRQSHDDPLNKE